MKRFILMIVVGILFVQVATNIRQSNRIDMLYQSIHNLNNRIELLEANHP